MKPEIIVTVLDRMVTKVDNALDELLDNDAPEVAKAERLLLEVTMELNGLIDRITDDYQEAVTMEDPDVAIIPAQAGDV